MAEGDGRGHGDGRDTFVQVVVVVLAEGRADRAGGPVEGGDGQDGVLVPAALQVASAVAPGAVFVDDPGGESGRGVGEGRGEGVGPGAHDLAVAPVVRVVCVEGVEVGLFGGGRRPLGEVGGDDGRGDVDSGDVLGIQGAEPLGDPSPDVPAEGAVLLVPESLGHQPVPDPGDRLTGEGPAGQRGVQEAGQGGDDHVEGVGGVAAVRGRVGERAGHLQHLHEAAGPAVCENEREGPGGAFGPPAPDVDEVHGPSVDLGGVLRTGVEGALGGPPVERLGPVGDELPQVGGVGPGGPAVGVGGGGEEGAAQTATQVVEDVVGDGDPERSGRHGSFVQEGSTGRAPSPPVVSRTRGRPGWPGRALSRTAWSSGSPPVLRAAVRLYVMPGRPETPLPEGPVAAGPATAPGGVRAGPPRVRARLARPSEEDSGA